MAGQEISVLVAFTAGVLSFLSPCVLPLVPIYLGYLTGQTSVSSVPSRRVTLTHASAFVLGFGGIFVLLGASVGLIGYLLLDILPAMVRVGGILLIVMGLHLAGVIRIPFLYMEKRLEMQRAATPTLWSSLLVGVIFGAGWTPCIGPVLGAILGLAAFSGTALQGAVLLAVYSLGLGVPFLLAALGLGSLSRYIRRMGPYLRYVEVTSGVLLILVGVLLYSNQFARLNSYLVQFTPAWLLERL